MADARRSTDDLVVRPGDTGEPAPRQEPARDEPLLGDREAEDFLRRWDDVQARFVDDPRAAVRDGDRLVSELMQALAARFGVHRDAIASGGPDGSGDDTEQLRVALQSYRSFFHRLLST